MRRLVLLAVVAAGVLIILIFNRQPSPSTRQTTIPLSSASVVGGDLPLRQYADQIGLALGAAVDVDVLRDDPTYRTVLAREFNVLIPENAMKFRNLSPEPNVYDFSDADYLVDFANTNQMRIRGHTLIWYKGLPDWVENGNLDAVTLAQIMRRHILTVAGRYRGSIWAWDVVNEAMEANGQLRDNIWLHAMGPGYIEVAFRSAHEADPNALLFYSDYGAEELNTKSDAIYELVKDLVKRGVPINGVAFHMHLRLDREPKLEDIRKNMQRLHALGLQVQISELDVRIQDVDWPMSDRLNKQAQMYSDILQLCLETEGCTSFSTWGFTDLHTWIEGTTDKPDAPLIFDSDYQPKPAYLALQAVLANAGRPG